MCSSTLRFASIFFAFLLVSTSGWVSPANAQDNAKAPDTAEPQDAAKAKEPTKLKKLLEERLAVARKLADLRVKQYESGVGNFEHLQSAQQALFKAELDVCESIAERVVVLEKMIALCVKTEKLVGDRFKAGTEREADVLAAKCTRLELEIALERLKQQASPHGHAVAFAKGSEGKLPDDWKEDHTGTGAGSVWRVRADATTPGGTGFVLAQTAASPKSLFNLCVFQDVNLKNLALQVAFKADKGEIDQGGGLVWRYQDAKNYYVARMNPLEDNFRVYKVQDGKRTQLQSAEKISVKQGTWHTIQVSQFGDRILCYLDGKRLLDMQDRTFTQPGKIGLWTKADARTSFGQFRWSDLGKKP